MINKNRIFIIAEAGVNHNGSMEMAKKLIDVAKEANVDAVKFQTFIPEKVISRKALKAEYQIEATGKEEGQLEMIKKLQLKFDDFVELKNYCDTKEIMFLSTPFDMESMNFLKSMNLGLWKIPSGEITNSEYLRKIGSFNDEVVFSTGMATLGEIENALELLNNAGTPTNKITILHCNTAYPTPMEDVNLNAMLTIKEAFKTKVGYSDHTLGIEIPVAAAALGASVIEKHFTLDKNLEGPDHKASLEPLELIKMVSAIRNIEVAMGSGIKSPSDSEIKNIDIARKSIHLSNDVYKGKSLNASDLILKRPGNGISPLMLDTIVGSVAKKDLKEDDLLTLTDFEWK